MDGTQILTLGLGLQAPWILKDQHLDTSVSPHRLDLYVEAERGSLYSCPECGQACPAHDFADKIWRHLNFFQHHCYLHARVPRTRCPEHGVKRIEVPWARPGSDFTLLFEQAAMSLVKEMPVLAVSRQLEISDKRLWRIVHHYVGRMLEQLNLSNIAAVGVDETASRRGQRYVTVFLDMQRKQEPVIFAVPGHGKEAIEAFHAFLVAHGGDPDNVVEVVCDMSQAFLSGVAEHLPMAEVTVDWFHIVQTFTKRLDEVRKKERREQGHPRSLRWALLKSLDNENLTPKQLAALQELVTDQSATADAWIIKEKLRWVQKASTPRAARWRITNYLKVTKAAVSEKPLLTPMGKALATLERHADAVVRRWISGLTNARLEGMNGLFQAARSRARGYRNEANFIAMIYLIGSPVGRLFDQAKST
ncbi:ISL3 family transposase [Halomonas sp. 141]|uniref:ISL3 family transposase n=1 Tax=Vreelandella hamiltonii TaxID=502829 RepID=A0A8H9I6J2_9GAMM|nr:MULTISPECIES: ISL3 family transposase [Halomonas]PJX12888.1 ISL3 family transposase [Halomonas sp. 141]GGW43038.1 ISL3 family transposase [Halomonas hamiltonii]